MSEAAKELARRFHRGRSSSGTRSPAIDCSPRTSSTTARREAGRDNERRIEFTSTTVLRVRDGLIAEAWDEMNTSAIATQQRL